MRRHLPAPSEDVSTIVEDLLTLAADPELDEAVSEYGVHAVLEERTITLILTFLERESYCCAEPKCHLPLDEGGEWERLRDLLDGEGLHPGRPLTLRCQAMVQPGARFDGSCGATVAGEPSELRRTVFVEDRV